MQVQMVHLLTTIRSGIELRLESAATGILLPGDITTPLLLCKLRRQKQHLAQQASMAFIAIRQRGNMLFWHNQKMYRGSRIDVVKRDEILIFENSSRWNLFRRDFTENAVSHE